MKVYPTQSSTEPLGSGIQNRTEVLRKQHFYFLHINYNRALHNVLVTNLGGTGLDKGDLFPETMFIFSTST